ncbi:MAG TPA: hypothetical protein VFP87_03235, partial [Chitinophagaceae bacterium]|nr:hypothetical protein [Chitinophagaceae bacterium]
MLSRSLLTSAFMLSSWCIYAQTNTPPKVSAQTIHEQVAQAVADSTLSGKGIKKVLIGENYRKEWTQPVGMPIFAMDGMTVVKPGGGKETKTLHLEDANGNKWALRSVEKFPANAIPELLRKTASEKLFKDGISASYPYGALSMGILSNAAHVPYLREKLVYVPINSSLDKFGLNQNLVMLLEDEEPVGIPKQSSENNEEKEKKTLDTREVIYELQQKGDNKVDQFSVLRARLLDNFVMDFDRHEDQWDWVLTGTECSTSFYIIPKDRDQVFYRGDGVLIKILSSKNMFPPLQGFRAKTRNVTTFNASAQNFDRYFLNQLSEADWSKEVDQFLRSMTDPVIETALHQQPGEIQRFSAERIINTLKEKRSYFKDEMMSYYRFLSHTVTIVGSNQREQFTILQNDDGAVTVKKNRVDSSQRLSATLYERTFDPRVTKEIRIYGLEGDDKFVLRGKKSPITIRLIGGPGNDEFTNYGDAGNVYVYDVSFEQNTFSGADNFKNRITGDPENNEYERLGYRYNSISPGIAVEYSFDGGLLLGPKLKILRQGFRQDPYASKQVFFITRRIGASAYHVKYDADFRKVL